MTHDPFKRFARLFTKGKGRETLADAANRLKLYHLVLDLALDAVKSTAQTMRRIYYRCSGQGMIPKGLKGERFIKTAMSTARWDGELPWERINDGGREFVQPTHWENATDFLESVRHRTLD